MRLRYLFTQLGEVHEIQGYKPKGQGGRTNQYGASWVVL